MDAVETLPLPENVMETAAVGESYVSDPPPLSSPSDLFKGMRKFESTLELGEVDPSKSNETDLPEDSLPEEPATPTEFQPPATSKGDEPSPKSSSKIPDPLALDGGKIQEACVGKIVFSSAF